MSFDLDIEPDEPAALVPSDTKSAPPPIASVMPSDFNIQTLLNFLPDIRLKKEIDELATSALAIDVTAENGLALADASLPPLREKIAFTLKCFEEVCSLANVLHKRMTGLRADFVSSGEAALKTITRRIVDENARRLRIAAEEDRKRQEAANEQARKDAAKLAEQAEQRGTPQPIVDELKKQVQTAVAPPVRSTAPPPLANTSTVAKWRCRVRGTATGEDPRPEIDLLTDKQKASLRAFYRAIADGFVPMAAAPPNYGYLDRRAGADKTQFDIPGFESYDEGGARKKGGR